MTSTDDHGEAVAAGSGLDAWIAELRADEVVRRRARTSWLRRQAGESATLVGTLAALCQSGAHVVVETCHGRRHRGTLRLVGDDVCAVRADNGGHVVLALDAVGAIKVNDATVSTVDDRPIGHAASMHEVLVALAGERPPVSVVARGSAEPLHGVLEVVGRDVAAVRLEGAPGVAYLPLTSLAEVSVFESG